ncbi:hypothetical protein U9M48_007771 [Paspalum notatum var. saurae]|uniref:Uncharacterized protein n=1 Tax=Paspalum notatum var. saurae TaxID=547442 RepID=A0AAQ3SN71_PASNO
MTGRGGGSTGGALGGPTGSGFCLASGGAMAKAVVARRAPTPAVGDSATGGSGKAGQGPAARRAPRATAALALAAHRTQTRRVFKLTEVHVKEREVFKHFFWANLSFSFRCRGTR